MDTAKSDLIRRYCDENHIPLEDLTTKVRELFPEEFPLLETESEE